MATIINRSKFVVTVRNRPDLTRLFPFNKEKEAEDWCKQLQQQGLKPAVKQLEDSILVGVCQRRCPVNHAARLIISGDS